MLSHCEGVVPLLEACCQIAAAAAAAAALAALKP